MGTINRREAAALVNSLTAGVVPRIGLRHVAVGRQKEVNAFLSDLATVQDGGGAFRFVCGKYGSGKSFLLQMIRTNAMERNFIVMDADLSPERRLAGTQRQGVATYRELMQHAATKMRPEGGALESVLQKWISTIQTRVAAEGTYSPNSPEFIEMVGNEIFQSMEELSEMACGFAFANVLRTYWEAVKTRNGELKQNCLRWLRGEYTSKREAQKDLPVDMIINDGNWYDFLKLFAAFGVKAGYQGLVIFLDEGVNLYKINNKLSREMNYEKVLTIFNDAMQGKAHYIGFFMSGTPQFVYDERRGMFSYEALRSRLSLNRFAQDGFVDYAGPVISLAQLTPEELYILLERLRDLHADYYGYEPVLNESDLAAFLNFTVSKMGADELLTPREVIRDFLGLLNVLHQDPNTTFQALISSGKVELHRAASNPDLLPETGGSRTTAGSKPNEAQSIGDNGDFADFEL